MTGRHPREGRVPETSPRPAQGGTGDLEAQLERLTRAVALAETLLDQETEPQPGATTACEPAGPSGTVPGAPTAVVGDGAATALALTRRVLEQASQRRALAPGLTVVALLGATGSGKSSLFNALAGAELAPTAVTRPTTTTPLAALPAGQDPSGQTAALLDWLTVDQRVELAGDPGLGAATVLLDLPDIDSDHPAHRHTAARLARGVDVLVWVLDPEKYADGVVHHDFLSPMAAHGAVTLVVLNQTDRLDEASREAVVADLARLLAKEDLGHVPIIETSARTGRGVDQLRDRLARTAATATAAELRLAADAETAATRLHEALGLQALCPPAQRDLSAERVNSLYESAARVAGVETVVHAVEGSMSLSAARQVGWLPLRWVGRLRRDPLRALHLGGGTQPARRHGSGRAARAGHEADDHPPVIPRTSLPEAGATAAGALRAAAHTTAAELTRAVPVAARADLVAGTVSRASQLPPDLDAAVAGTDLGLRRPRWWTVANAVQWILGAVALAGGLWQAALVAMDQLLLIPIDPPRWGIVPWPVVLLAGGLALGLLAAGAGRAVARTGARRRARGAGKRLRRATDEVVERELLNPLRERIAAWDELDRLLRPPR